MSAKLNELKALLKKLFQFDNAELDFGIYRIMNQKHDEIEKFLEEDLLPQVNQELEKYKSGDQAEVKEELAKLEDGLKDAGVDPETSPKVQELKEKLKSVVDVSAIENEIYSHLSSFFKRYYHEGDFLSLRRYKEGVYAIPYEGEEVKLHWANSDQYYIKSAENFKDYVFKVSGDKKVHFKIVEATTEVANNKVANGKQRFFVLRASDEETQTAQDREGELFIYFEYRQVEGNTSQAKLNEEAVEKLLSMPELNKWNTALARKAPTEKNPNRSILEKHLTDYTSRNTFDYFIHKDLGGFLRRELDFYIKNEIMHLDDIDTEREQDFSQYLSKIKVVKRIGHKIIAFLEQLENFQKKLWLKKKFVVETNYCITLDLVPAELYSEIIENAEQIEEWKRLFAIEEIERDITNPGYSEPLSREFLKVNKFLVLDTKFFGEDFKNRLIAGIDDVDERCDGLLVHSENFQGLELVRNRYESLIRCCYIDPPFNLKQNADFLYKTDYRDSSWLCLLKDRITLGLNLLRSDGMQYIRCDDNGNHLVRFLGDQLFGISNYQYELSVQRIRKNVTGQGKISLPLANDSLFMYFKSDSAFLVNPYLKLKETREAYWRRIDDSAGYRNPPERKIFGKIFHPYKQDAHFKYSQTSIDRMTEEGRIRLLCKSCRYEHLNGDWSKCPKCGENTPVPQYLVQPTDTKVLDTNWMDISGYASTTGFSTENSEALLRRALEVGSEEGDYILDYFAGSGTTAAVAHKMKRKWCTMEMGEQFDLFVLPRLKNVVKECKRGFFRYIKLESYEDVLINLSFKKTAAQQIQIGESKELREDYILHYMLDVEAKGSASLLNIDAFEDPFNYKMQISSGTVGESKLTRVDLVETFNWLLGLRVQNMDHIQGFRVVRGKDPEGRNVLIIWRNLKEKSNADLDQFFMKQNYNTLDFEFDKIYVNGDNNLENLKVAEDHWKVSLIEEEFKKRMFDVQDV